MRRKLKILDTNILVRLLINDDPIQVDAVEKLLSQAKPKSFFIPDIVVAETVFVLQSRYNVSKEDVLQKMTSLIAFDKFVTDKVLLQKTLDIYSNHAISFVDAYLSALTMLGRNSTLYTFDKRLLSILHVTVSKP